MSAGEIVKQLAHVACRHCKGHVFRVAIFLESGEFVVRCTACQDPYMTGAKLSPEAHRKMLDDRAKEMAKHGVVN